MQPDLLNMPVIDAHLHLWDDRRMHYPWLDAVPGIGQSFFTKDYRAASKGFHIEKMIFVEADRQPGEYFEEVAFVEEQAEEDNRICAMVAYAPVEQGRAVKKILDTLKYHPMVKGVRRMYDDKAGLCCSTSFIEGLHLLPSYGFSFDISIKPHLMKETIAMISRCPETRFILDHLGKPDIRNQAFDAYKKDIEQLAALPNLTAKISGLITEAAPDWSPEDIKPYIDHAIACFGHERLMFGGDWPVVLLAGSFERWVMALAEALEGYPSEVAEMIFYKNAARIYDLN